MGELPNVKRKVNAGLYGQRQTPPEPSVHLHQHSSPSVGIGLELHHGYAFPLQGLEKLAGQLDQNRIRSLSHGHHRHTSSVGKFFQPPVLKCRQTLAAMQEYLNPNAMA